MTSWRRAAAWLLGAATVTAGLAGGPAALAQVAGSLRAGPPKQTAPAVGSLAASVAHDEQVFALDLLQRLGPSAANLVLSPASLAALLSMVEPGAAGTTQAGIAKALHSAGLSAAEQAGGWRALDHLLAAAATRGKLTLHTANGAWLQDGLPVRQGYLALLKEDFGAGVEHANLDGDPAQAAAAIDSWVASRTGGHITHLVDAAELADVVAVLVDAVYMDAPWARAFPASLTAPSPFYVSPTETVRVPMMSSGGGTAYPVAVGPSLEAAELPYAGGQTSALVVMPRAGRPGNLASLEAALTPARLAGVLASLRKEPALVELPRFDLASDLQMNALLSAMGMGQAFTNSADFSNLSPVSLELSFVVHDAQIEVTEKGTEASAASGTGIMPTAVALPAGPQLIFDHPFLFFVRDDATGAVIFEAQVGNPAAG